LNGNATTATLASNLVSGISITNAFITNSVFAGNGAGLTNTTTAGNYVYAYDTTTQTAISANTFQAVTLNNNGQINGWTHTTGTASFTSGQAGLYLVQYAAVSQVTAGAPQTNSLNAVLNGTEIAGSQSATALTVANEPVSMSKSFIVSVAAANVLQFQFAGSSTSVQLVSGAGTGTTKPGFSVTIVRIQ
jgi:hypothetical protein